MRYFCLRCAALLLLGSAPALGAVRFDSAASTQGTGGKGSVVLTVGTGANRFVVVAVAMPANVSVIDRSFAGRPLGSFGDARNSGCHVEVYGGVAPPSGAGTANVTVSSTAPFVLAVAAYDGVDQGLPTDDSSAQNTGPGTAPFGYTITSAPGIAFGALCATGSISATAAATGQNLRWSRTTGNLLGAGADGPDKQVGWQLTASGTVGWAVASMPLRAAPGGAPVPLDAGAPPDAAPPRDTAPPRSDTAPAPAPEAGPPEVSDPPEASNPPDTRGQPPPDAWPPVADGNLPLPKEPPEPDAAPAFRVIDLQVGTGCGTAPGHAPRSLAALTLVGLLVVVARRRRE